MYVEKIGEPGDEATSGEIFCFVKDLDVFYIVLHKLAQFKSYRTTVAYMGLELAGLHLN